MTENTTEQVPGAWQKGGPSPNPGGRPAVLREVRDLARGHTEAAVAALAACLDDPDGRVRVAAATALLDRGWGRPVQAVVADVQVAAVDVDSLRAALAARVTALATAGGGEPPTALPDASAGARIVETRAVSSEPSAPAPEDRDTTAGGAAATAEGESHG